MQNSTPLHVVIVGAGFGGLYAAKALRKLPVNVTVIDRRNFHLFQPLLYQVATGSLSPGDIAAPIRTEFHDYPNVNVLQAEVQDIDPKQKTVTTTEGKVIGYDLLLVATGSHHSYFGHDEWEPLAPGLKSIEDALEIRGRVLHAFEAAELEDDPAQRAAWLTFVIVGGGPTGVELAGAIGELAHQTLRGEYRSADPAKARIILVEGEDRLIPPYAPTSSAKAADALIKLGVEVRCDARVTELHDGSVAIKEGEKVERVAARTILWAAGNKANSLGKLLQERTGAELDRAGRVVVNDNLEVPTAPHVFVIGDLAHFKQPDGKPLPAVAPVAMQQGKYFAKLVKARLAGRTPTAFEYFNKGNLAVIGRNQAIAELGKVHIYGFFAWIAWVFVHIAYLIQFESRVIVLFRWAVNYITRRRGARLITGEGLPEPKSAEPTGHHPTPESSANTSGVAGSTPTAAPLSQTAAGGQTL